MTILELLLALAISTIVLYLLGVAIDMQWRLFDTRRSRVEVTLLARSVLRRISDDLRAAVLFSPPDLEGLNAVANNPLTQLAGAASGNTDPLQALAGASGTAPATEPEANASGSEDPMAAPTPSQTIVGMYGTSNWLAIDVSRLPRIDEYDAVYAADSTMTPLDIPSDVKTINYYIAASELGEGEDAPLPAAGDATAVPVLKGLVRQQMSRAVSAFNAEGGASDEITGAQILAEEVTGIEFAYFDGYEWLSEWSSNDYGGLPLAVAIAIQIEMKASRVQSLFAATQGADVDQVKSASVHRIVVHLPAARRLPPVDPASETSEMPEEGSETNSGSGQPSAGSQPSSATGGQR